MECCLCKVIKRCFYMCSDCCYKIEDLDSTNYIGIYCSYPYCPSNYNLKENSSITIKYRGHFYCNKKCLNMHKSTNYYKPSAADISPFEYSEYTNL